MCYIHSNSSDYQFLPKALLTVLPTTRCFIILFLAEQVLNPMVCQHSLHHILVSPLVREQGPINTENTHMHAQNTHGK